MCLIAFAIQASERWPLVIAANRDEFFNRPTVPLARWQTGSGQTLISGRDLRAGGTWLGLTPGGRCALLTNVRQAQNPPAARSRGELVMRWLESDLDTDQFMAQTDSAAYGGFNLVLGDFQRERWTWLSNRSLKAGADSDFNEANVAGLELAQRTPTAGWRSRDLPPGVYGLSNAALDTPWPKTLALKTALTDALQAADAATLEAPLWAALSSRRRASPKNLPNTGVAVDIEESLSSAFVEAPERGYGTRCSTLLVASAANTSQQARSWTLRIQEKTHFQRQEEIEKKEKVEDLSDLADRADRADRANLALGDEEDFRTCELDWCGTRR